jgi:hypothetical protein
MSSGKKWLIAAVIVVAVVLAIIALRPRGAQVKTAESGPVVVEESVPSDPEKKQAFDRRKAASACRVAIMQSLKDPSTAEFADEIDATPWVAEDGGDYSFKLSVRARNQSGMVTRRFDCRAHPEASGWSIAHLAETAGP